tara:strand:- start:142 stop:681 length:540 start_codon:yes stop_codon:yes gene_type:complete
MYTIIQKINIAKISQYLCLNDIDKKGLFGGGVDLQLPNKIYNIRKSVEWLYNLSPTDASLVSTSDYLYALCAPYNLEAGYIINNFTNGSIINPYPYITIISPIRITELDFIDATHWAGQNSVNQPILSGYRLQVFGNFIARYLLEGTEWVRTVSGVNIIMPGFDATTQQYEFYIDISLY